MARALTSPFLLIFFFSYKEGRKNRVLILVSETLCEDFVINDDTEVDWLRLPSAVVLNIGTFNRLFELRGYPLFGGGGVFFCACPFLSLTFYGKRFAMKLPCNIWRERTLLLEVKFNFLCINKHWKFITIEVVRGKIKLLYDF